MQTILRQNPRQCCCGFCVKANNGNNIGGSITRTAINKSQKIYPVILYPMGLKEKLLDKPAEQEVMPTIKSIVACSTT